ncbi:MAG: hypothetical protein WAU47_12165 [Desulfobaccales bacterium]
MKDLENDRDFLKAAQESIKAETKEFVQVSDRLHNNLLKALKLMWRQLLIIWAVLITLFIGYFFLLSKTSTPDNVAKETKSPQGIASPEAMVDSPAAPLAKPSADAALTPALDGIRGILNQIREAQLKKDINLFLEAYSPNFPKLDKKKENLLKTWKRYDYVDMTFNIENIQKQQDDTIVANVAWDIVLEDVHSRKKRNLSRNYTIRFSNGSGKWHIQELLDRTGRLG